MIGIDLAEIIGIWNHLGRGVNHRIGIKLEADIGSGAAKKIQHSKPPQVPLRIRPIVFAFEYLEIQFTCKSCYIWSNHAIYYDNAARRCEIATDPSQAIVNLQVGLLEYINRDCSCSWHLMINSSKVQSVVRIVKRRLLVVFR